MPKPMTAEEANVRRELDAAVIRIKAAIARCPAVGDLDHIDPADATSIVAEANTAMSDAASCAAILEHLADASDEAALIASSARIALSFIRQALTLLSAELDSRAA